MKPKDKFITASLQLLANTTSTGSAVRFGETGIKYNGSYKGYIASFGGAIVQTGILQACLAFIADEKKNKLMTDLFLLYKTKVKTSVTEPLFKTFLEKAWNDNSFNRKEFRNKIAELAVSYKMALRTFEPEDRND